MRADATGRDIEIALQRFFDLPPREQLRAYRAIRDYLGERIRETKSDRIAEQRAAALKAFEQVAGHLRLPAGTAPTPNEFDAVARELGLGWNRSRVRRAWGRWRFAKEQFLGERWRETAYQENLRRSAAGKKHRYVTHQEALRRWVATSPADVSPRAYETWAREHNEATASGGETSS